MVILCLGAKVFGGIIKKKKELKQLKTSYKFLLIPILLIESLPPFLVSLAYNAVIHLKHHLNNYQVALI